MDFTDFKRKERRVNDRQRSRVNISARIDANTADVLLMIAEENGVSRNLIVNKILEDFVNEYTQ